MSSSWARCTTSSRAPAVRPASYSARAHARSDASGRPRPGRDRRNANRVPSAARRVSTPEIASASPSSGVSGSSAISMICGTGRSSAITTLHSEQPEKPSGWIRWRHICSTSDWVRTIGRKGASFMDPTLPRSAIARERSSTGPEGPGEKEPQTGQEPAIQRKRCRMSIEYAGAVEVAPRLPIHEQTWARTAGWTPSRDGRMIRPRADLRVEVAVHALRDLVALDRGRRTYEGVVAAYDVRSRELVTITVQDGRVRRRTVHAPTTIEPRSNVIDLATHRRRISRAIS